MVAPRPCGNRVGADELGVPECDAGAKQIGRAFLDTSGRGVLPSVKEVTTTMSYRWLLSALTLIVIGWSAEAGAQMELPTDTVTGNNATFTIDVLPLQAEVRLDGVRLGTAHDLIALALPVLPGDHVVQISADGHLTNLVQVVGVPNWATRVQVHLVPDRRP